MFVAPQGRGLETSRLAIKNELLFVGSGLEMGEMFLDHCSVCMFS
jgi:hypothetical protein